MKWLPNKSQQETAFPWKNNVSCNLQENSDNIFPVIHFTFPEKESVYQLLSFTHTKKHAKQEDIEPSAPNFHLLLILGCHSW